MFVQYKSSYEQSLNLTQDGIKKQVDKNVELLNNFFKKVEQTALNSMINPLLYEALDVNLDTSLDNIIASPDINMALTSIFVPYYDDVQYQLITDKYFFGSSYPKINTNLFWENSYIKKAQELDGKGMWISTFDAYEGFTDFEFGKEFDVELRNVLSYVVALQLIDVTTNRNLMPKGISKDPVLLISFKEQTFYEMLETSSSDIDKEVSFYILDNNNTIISAKDKNLIQSKVNDDWVEQIPTTVHDSVIIGENKDKQLIIHNTTSNGWKVVATIPYSNIVEPIHKNTRSTLLMTAMIFISIAIFAIITLYFYLSKPIHKLIKGFKLSSTGDFSYVLDTKKIDKEFQEIYLQYNDMNERLKNLIDENYKVKLREKEIEIAMLNMQLNPHFIFNTLNTINWIAIENNQEVISQIIQNLCIMLEYNLRHKGDQSQLFNDIIWLKAYCEIMQQRYIDVFEVTYDIDSKLVKQAIPKLMLQPLVENAIIHGFKDFDEGGVIKISAYVEDQHAVIIVADNGCGIPKQKMETIFNESSQKSIGVLNVHNRLKLLYGDKYGLKINSDTNGTEIIIKLPLLDLPDDGFKFNQGI